MASLANRVRQTSGRLVAAYDPQDVQELRRELEPRARGKGPLVRAEDAASPEGGAGFALWSESGLGALGVFSEVGQLEIQFEEGYEMPGEFMKCLEYIKACSCDFMEVLVSRRALRYLALVFDYQMPFSTDEGELLVAKAMPFKPILGGSLLSAKPHDFSKKVAVMVDDTYFVNLQMDVYETRTFNLRPNHPAAFNPLLMSTTHLHRARVSERGFHLQTDVNTKRLAQRQIPVLHMEHWSRCMELSHAAHDHALGNMILTLEG